MFSGCLASTTALSHTHSSVGPMPFSDNRYPKNASWVKQILQISQFSARFTALILSITWRNRLSCVSLSTAFATTVCLKHNAYICLFLARRYMYFWCVSLWVVPKFDTVDSLRLIFFCKVVFLVAFWTFLANGWALGIPTTFTFRTHRWHVPLLHSHLVSLLETSHSAFFAGFHICCWFLSYCTILFHFSRFPILRASHFPI